MRGWLGRWGDSLLGLAIGVGLLVMWIEFAGTRPWLAWLFWLLPVAPLLVLPVVYVLSVWRGLATRTGVTSRVLVEADAIVFEAKGRSTQIRRAAIAQARHAVNGNWTESRVVEDAVTMFDIRGRRLAKIPASASGYGALLQALRSSVAMTEVEVEAPAYLD